MARFHADGSAPTAAVLSLLIARLLARPHASGVRLGTGDRVYTLAVKVGTVVVPVRRSTAGRTTGTTRCSRPQRTPPSSLRSPSGFS